MKASNTVLDTSDVSEYEELDIMGRWVDMQAAPPNVSGYSHRA